MKKHSRCIDCNTSIGLRSKRCCSCNLIVIRKSRGKTKKPPTGQKVRTQKAATVAPPKRPPPTTLVGKLKVAIERIEELTIKDMGGHLHRMGDDCELCGTKGGLKRAQQMVLALYLLCKDRRIPIRIIILKARKEGISTLVEALMLLETIKRGIDALVIAHDDKATQKIFEISERLHRTYPRKKPALAKCNVHEIKFKDQEGHMQVLTAGNVYAGTALTPQFVHMSEMPKWPKGVATATALFQAIADLPDTCIIVECTAEGFDPLFKPMWEAAENNCKITWKEEEGLMIPDFEVLNREEWNGYLPSFIPWFDDPQYSKPFHYDGEAEWFAQNMTPEEKAVMEKYSLSPEQMNSYRSLLKKCQNDKKIRSQEYPCNFLEAFIYSGRPRFNIEILSAMQLEEPVRGTLAPAARMSRKIVFGPDPQGDVYRWAEPVMGHTYVIGVDTAEGLMPTGSKHPDATVVQVFDRTVGGLQVCKMYGQISEDELVDPLVLLCEYYNGAWCVIEKNNTGKMVARDMANKYDKQRLYKEHDEDDPQKRSRKIGFTTHGTNRRMWVGKVAELINDRSLIFKDKQTVSEMIHFHITEGGKAEAALGFHDDHVSAVWLAVVGFQSYPDNLRPYNPYQQTRNNPPRSYRYQHRIGERPGRRR